MIIVMALNTGIVEIYSITSLAGLFFGMNILGACTEIIMEQYENLKESASKMQDNAWL
jgi:hypothetical protein